MIVIYSLTNYIDDFLSLVFTSYLTKDTIISRSDHADAKKAIVDTSVICITLGGGRVLGTTENTRNTDLNVEASFVRIAKRFNITLPEDSLWGYFSTLSTKGSVEARKAYNKTLREATDIDDIIQPVLRTWCLVSTESVTETSMFMDISAFLSRNSFDLTTCHLGAIRNIVKRTYPDEYEEAIKQLAQEKL